MNGINPLPSRRSIPVWMGGESPVVVHRAARMADGWMPHFRPGPEAQAVVDRLHGDIKSPDEHVKVLEQFRKDVLS